MPINLLDLELVAVDHDEIEAEYRDEQTSDELTRLADGFNCKVYIPPDNVLTIDLDTKEDIMKFPHRLKRLKESGFQVSELGHGWKSKSKGYHKLVTLGDAHLYSLPEKLMMQVALGSDPKREMITLRRWRRGQKNLRILFMPKQPALPFP